ncbi:hypothetical protein [Geodermatophilus telluris]|nr:hypothetical protein [Geodermatophilus telluris]
MMLWNKVPVPVGVAEWAVVRISDPEAREELANLKKTLTYQSAGTRIGTALARLGPDITEDTTEGHRDRLIAGLETVTYADLDPRAPRHVVAYAGVVAGVLVTLIPASAVENDLPAFDGDRTGAPRNGATAFLLEGINTLPALRVIATPKVNRLVRNLGLGMQVLDAMRHRDVELLAEGISRDLTDPSSWLLTTIDATTKGDGNAVQFKQDVLAGRINRLDAGDVGHSKRDFNYHACPPGYGPVWRDTPDGGRLPDKGSITVVEHLIPMVALLWRQFAAGLTYRQIGETPGLAGWPLRDGSGRTLGDLPAQRRINIVRQMLTPAYARLHRTGLLDVERSTSAPIKDAAGRKLTRRPDGRRATTITMRLPVPYVDGSPWGIPTDVWQGVDKQHARRNAEIPADRGGQWSTQLMHLSPMWHKGGRWWRFVHEHTTLQLRYMPGPADQPPVWDNQRSKLAASTNMRHAFNLLGHAFLEALAGSAARSRPLTAVAGTEPAQVRELRAALSRARARQSAAGEKAARAKDLAQLAMDGNAPAAAAEHLRDQQLSLEHAAEAQTQIAQFEADLAVAAAAPPQDEADLRTPIGVATALMHWNGEPDAELRRAVAGLRLVEGLSGRYDTTTGCILARTVARIALTDGTEADLPVKFEWPNTSNVRPAGVEAAGMVAAWARGATVEKLAAKHARTAAWVRATMVAWFAERGIDTMSTALLDNPVLVTRQTVVAAVAPRVVPMPRGLTAATIAVLTAPYLHDAAGAWKAWTGCVHAPDRRLVAVLRVAGGAADVAPLQVAADADPARLAKPFGRRPAICMAPATARRALRRCPHEGCAGLLTHVLYVPETAAYGVICPTCLRLPDPALADAPLPGDYLVKWEREATADGLRTRRATAAELRLADVGIARLAGDLLRGPAAAQLLQVTVGTVGDLHRRGELPSVTVAGATMYERATVIALAQKRAVGHRGGIKDGLMSPAQVARRLGVPEWRVREYCDQGLLAYKRVPRPSREDRRLHPSVVAAFVPAAGDLIEAMPIPEVVRRSGRSRSFVEKEIDRGHLATVRTSTGDPRVLPAAFDAWIKSVPRTRVAAAVPATGAGVINGECGRMSVSAAAAVLGLSAKQVRLLAASGVLDDHRGDGTGWRWFDAAAVHALAEARQAGQAAADT